MDAISQTTFSNAFSWMKMFEFRLKFHWSLFLKVRWTIFQYWFRYWLGAVQATSHYLNQWWLVYRRIHTSLHFGYTPESWRNIWQYDLSKLALHDNAPQWQYSIISTRIFGTADNVLICIAAFCCVDNFRCAFKSGVTKPIFPVPLSSEYLRRYTR